MNWSRCTFRKNINKIVCWPLGYTPKNIRQKDALTFLQLEGYVKGLKKHIQYRDKWKYQPKFVCTTENESSISSRRRSSKKCIHSVFKINAITPINSSRGRSVTKETCHEGFKFLCGVKMKYLLIHMKLGPVYRLGNIRETCGSNKMAHLVITLEQ